MPEVIYGASKTPVQIATIVERMVTQNGRAIVTRASREAVEAVRAAYPEAQDFEVARMIAVGEFPVPQTDYFVAVVSAGTSDLPIAEEAALTIELLGTRVERVYDVGVAGVHRLLDRREVLWKASAVVRWPAWKARSPPSSAVWSIVRRSPCRRAWATARVSTASRRYLPC